MASLLLPSMRRVALKAIRRPTSSLLRLTAPARNFSDIADPSPPKPQLQQPELKDALRKLIAFRDGRVDTLRKLVALGLLDLPKPLEEMSAEEHMRIFKRAHKEMKFTTFKLPSGEERDKRPKPKLIARCEKICALLETPLPFDKDTANVGEVTDALLRLSKRRYDEDPEPKAVHVPEENRELSPTQWLKRMAYDLKIQYDPTTSRGELADMITERFTLKWKERRALAKGEQEGGDLETGDRAAL